ncbi:MAG: ATP-grasp domain-containing protein [Actinobacteria bacterium]|nr:ATP-grasp domain-containing protein [Actinomycetota bacterium]
MARILIIAPTGTYRAAAFVAAAKRLGVEIVTACDKDIPIPSGAHNYIVTLPLDSPHVAAEQVIQLDRKLPIDAIMALDDRGVELAALAGERLGLVHNDPESAARTLHKNLQREAMHAAEVAQPTYRTIDPADQRNLERNLNTTTAVTGFPCVIKANSLSGSQGVIRADNLPQALDAANRVRSIQAREGYGDDIILVERYIGGYEIAIEGLLQHGQLTVLAVFDKPMPMDGPFFEESIYITPSMHDTGHLEAAVDATRRAVVALGLESGPIHAELRVEDGIPYVIEVAARTIGGRCSSILRFEGNRSLEELVIASAIDSMPSSRQHTERNARLRTIPGFSGVLMLYAPVKGTLAGIHGLDEAVKITGITGMDITAHPGRSVAPPPEGADYIGFVFAHDLSRDRVKSALIEAANTIRVVVDPPQ